MLDKFLYLVSLAALAVVYADVLVRPGMLLEPVQRWLRWGYAHLCGNPVPGIYRELDTRWWWPPLWGCYKCVAGQWGFWGYLTQYHAHYNLFEHLAFTAFTIITAIILHRWTQE